MEDGELEVVGSHPGLRKNRRYFLNNLEKSWEETQSLGEVRTGDQVRTGDPAPGSQFRAQAMVRDLERKDEAQRIA